MIIYGSKMYGVKNVVYTHGVCDHCGHYVKQKSYDGRKFGHLYFIPLIPEGGRVRVLKECPKCNMGQHVPVDTVPGLYGEVERLLGVCFEAAAAGEHTFTDPKDNEQVDTGPFLAQAVEVLTITGHAADVPGIIKLLEDDGAAYEAAVAAGAYDDIQGRQEQAAAATQRAAEIAPDLPYPPAVLAEHARRRGDAQAWLDHLRHAHDLVGGQDVGLMLQMIDPLEALQRFDELVAVMEECVRLVPELGRDKKFMKLHKKYGKKADKQATR